MLILTRVKEGASPLRQAPETLRQARQIVAWCCTDNLGKSRQEASRTADKLVIGEPLQVGPYTYTLTREGVAR